MGSGTACDPSQHQPVHRQPLLVRAGREGRDSSCFLVTPFQTHELPPRGSDPASATSQVPSTVHIHPDSSLLHVCVYTKCFSERSPAVPTPRVRVKDKSWGLSPRPTGEAAPIQPGGAGLPGDAQVQGCWDSYRATWGSPLPTGG